MNFANIPIASITVLPGRRRLDPAWVATLAELMDTPAQCSPIELVTAGEGYELVFGGHRLAAGKKREWETIPAIVKDRSEFANQAEIILREITENLARRDLSVLDRSVDIARWRDIYEATHQVAKAGRPKKAGSGEAEKITDMFVRNFSDAAKAALNVTDRTIRRFLQVATIPADIRDRLALHAIAGNHSELLLIAAEPSHRQSQIADLLLAEPAKAACVGDAIAMIDRLPPKPKAEGWAKVAEAFSNLRPADQDRFFRLHEAAITLWLKERAS